MAISSKSQTRLRFFDLLFQENEGYLCIASTHPELPKASFQQNFFEWPKQAIELENFILAREGKFNFYFCINLLSEPERRKDHCLPTDLLWADLDDVNPHQIEVPPPIVVQSSPERWQAFWRVSEKLNAFDAEEYSKRIAYAYGADKSGWDLTQLFRVPLTYNFKYENQPIVDIERSLETRAPLTVFEALPKVATLALVDSDQPLPEDDELPSVEDILVKYTLSLRRTPFTALYSQEPTSDDWSKILWRLIHTCFESGMSTTEVYAVVRTAKCNKYSRDGRPLEHLWRDILKAEEAQKNITVLTSRFRALDMPKLVDEQPTGTFLDTYRDWAKDATDAVVQFHDLSCTILLSSIVSNSVRLQTSHGPLVPNLWGLILGDSTLTRKTTAMRMAMDLLTVLDKEMVLATDGSAEGLLTGLSTRPNRTSIFFKDEVSGFFDAISRKEYLAGMAETLTHLYDVPPIFTRRLRKEVIIIESPSFIFFGGGVRERVYGSLTEEHVTSGFLPRFLVVSGDTDLTRLRPTGPATETIEEKRQTLINFLSNLYENYAADIKQKIAGQRIVMPARYTAKLTDEAWKEYQRIEATMVVAANDSAISHLALPTFERLSRSLLKMSIILGASRQEPKNDVITISREDILNAAWYIQDWGTYSIELVTSAGKKASEKLLEKIVQIIESKPGILKSTLMQHYHLSRREVNDIIDTLEDRQLIRKERRGSGWSFYIA